MLAKLRHIRALSKTHQLLPPIPIVHLFCGLFHTDDWWYRDGSRVLLAAYTQVYRIKAKQESDEDFPVLGLFTVKPRPYLYDFHPQLYPYICPYIC